MYLKINEFDNIDDIPDYFDFQYPYVIRGGCKSMKIFSIEHKLQFFLTHFKNVKCRTELYNSISEMENNETLGITINPFIETYDYIINKKKPYHFIADFDIKDEESDVNAQVLSYFNLDMDKKRDNKNILLFLGNDSRSGAHIHLINDYVLNQIYGKKTIYMFDYNDNPLETDGIFSQNTNFLKDNIFQLDHSKLKIYKVELNEGDILTIPPWWWHAAKGTDLSLSITKTYLRNDYRYVITKPYILSVIITEFIVNIYNYLYYVFEKNDIFIIILSLIILTIYYQV